MLSSSARNNKNEGGETKNVKKYESNVAQIHKPREAVIESILISYFKNLMHLRCYFSTHTSLSIQTSHLGSSEQSRKILHSCIKFHRL